MTRKQGNGAVRALALGCLALVASGCNLDVFNPGAITEESLNDATLMTVVVNGVANEFNQIVDGASFDIARFSDDLAGTGSYFQTGRLRRGALDWEETAGDWGQVHETIWTGQQAWARMQSLETFDETTSDIAARAWMLVGHAHRFFGELFCEVVYSTGIEEGAGVQPRESAFDSAVAAFNQAITIGTAAGATDFVTAARAGLAQSYMGLASLGRAGAWAQAVSAAQQVPTDFAQVAFMNQTTNSNFVHDETWDRNEGGVFGTYAWRIASPDTLTGTTFTDPRAGWTICGRFDAGTGTFPYDEEKDADVTPTGAAGCTSHQGADGVTAHYRQDKYPDDGSDIPYAMGVEMRLIEAEAALEGGDLTEFTIQINAVRDHYGLSLISEPASAGALEYPNAYDASTGSLTIALPGTDAADIDGWSILDGERYLTTWLEGRRMWDLHRWQHPFLDGGIVFWDTETRRASCYPVPEQECQLNRTLAGATLLTGTGTATQTCS